MHIYLFKTIKQKNGTPYATEICPNVKEDDHENGNVNFCMNSYGEIMSSGTK